MVHSRVNHFRAKYAGYSIETDLVTFDFDKGFCICKAIVRDEKSHIIASGLAHEFRDDRSSMVNKTSFVENAETSAIGRALACLGIGTEDSYASSFEVENAIHVTRDSVTEDSATIPSVPGAEQFKGRVLNTLNMEELLTLSAKAKSEKWKNLIAHAMNTLNAPPEANTDGWE